MCVYGVVLINILVLQLGPPKQKFLAPPLNQPLHTNNAYHSIKVFCTGNIWFITYETLTEAEPQIIKLEQIEVLHHDPIVNFHVFQETILWFSFNTTSILRDPENNKRKQSSATSPCVKLTIFSKEIKSNANQRERMTYLTCTKAGVFPACSQFLFSNGRKWAMTSQICLLFPRFLLWIPLAYPMNSIHVNSLGALTQWETSTPCKTWQRLQV